MTKILPPTPRACAQCPWRLSNQGTRHPHGFYTKANLKRLWNGLRSGKAPGMSCHPTDPRMAEFSGYEETADRERTYECAGSVILLLRETFRFQAICHEMDQQGRKDSLREYRRRMPQGLTKEGMGEIVWRLLAGGSPLARELRASAAALDDLEIGYPPLGDWDPEILVQSQEFGKEDECENVSSTSPSAA